MKCYILFCVIFICKKKFFGIFTCSKDIFISDSSARIAAMAAMDGSIRNLISIRSLIIFCLSSIKVRPRDHQSSGSCGNIWTGALAYGDYITWCECSHSFTQRASSNIQPFTHYGFVRKLVTKLQVFISMYLIILSAILWERVFLWNFACDLPPVAQCLDV